MIEQWPNITNILTNDSSLLFTLLCNCYVIKPLFYNCNCNLYKYLGYKLSANLLINHIVLLIFQHASIPDILNIVILRNNDLLFEFRDVSEILQNLNSSEKSEDSGDI